MELLTQIEECDRQFTCDKNYFGDTSYNYN